MIEFKSCNDCAHYEVDVNNMPCAVCATATTQDKPNWTPINPKAADAACDGANKVIADHAEGNLSNEQMRAMLDAMATGTGVLKTERIDPNRAFYTIPEMMASAKANEESEIKQHPLYPIFMAAIKQAMYGKGQRHGGNVTPFLDQPWAHYFKMHGRGFLTGQAAKKLEEAASTRNGEGFETEVFGALVYIGMSVLAERGEIE